MRIAIVATFMLVAQTLAYADDSCSKAYSRAKEVEGTAQCRVGAEAGNAEAQFGYALVLWSGHGRKARPREALEWFRKAARQGHLLSRVTLGRLLSSEEAAPDLRAKAEGYAWWVAAGEKDAAASLKLTFSPTESVRAEQLAQQFTTAYGPSR